MSLPFGSIQKASQAFIDLGKAIGGCSWSLESFAVVAARAKARRRRALRGVLFALCGVLVACSVASKDQLLPVAGERAASWFAALSPWLEIGSGVLGVLTCWGAVAAWVRRKRDPLSVERRRALSRQREHERRQLVGGEAGRRALPRGCNRRRERGAPSSWPNLDENDPEIRRLLEIAKTLPPKPHRYPSGGGCSGNVPPPDRPTPILQLKPTDWNQYEGPEPATVPRIGDPHPVTLSTPGGLTAQDLERLKARMDGAYQPQISLDTWRRGPGALESVVLTMAKWKELQPPLPPPSGSPWVIANFLRNYPPPNPPPGTGSLDLAHEQYLALMDAIPRHGLSDEEVCTRCQNIGDAFDAAGWDVRWLVASLPPRFLEPPTGNRGTQ